MTSRIPSVTVATRIIPVRHYGRWAGAFAILLIGLAIVDSMVTNPRFQWDIVFRYFTSEAILKGAGLTVLLTLIAMVGGVSLGTVLAVMRLSSNPVLRGSAWVYVAFFRGTPLLVQLIFWFNLAALYPELTISLPLLPEVSFGDTNAFITPFTAAVLGLTLNEAAYMSEIVRAGIISVDHGQSEAGTALALDRGTILRRIILPQAMKFIVPPTGNQMIAMLKTTSLVSVISLADLLYSTQIIISNTFQPIPLLITAAIWYFLMSSVLVVIQYYIERRYARGESKALPPTPLEQIRNRVGAVRIRLSRGTGAGGR